MHYVQNFGGVKWAMNEKSIGRVRIGGMGFRDLKAFNLLCWPRKVGGWSKAMIHCYTNVLKQGTFQDQIS